MAFRRKPTTPTPTPVPPAAPPPRRTPWFLYVLLLIGLLIGAQYLGCPVLTESESTEWMD